MVRFASFLGSDDSSHFHSNTMADTSSAQESFGTTRNLTFNERQAINKNRQHIRSYRDAGILHTYRSEAHDKKVSAQEQSVEQTVSNDQYSERPLPKQVTPQSSRIDIVRPARQGFNATKPPAAPAKLPYQRQSFIEPTSRKYNPFA